VAIVLRPLADDELDRMFVWENDERAVEMAAFTRADSSDRRSFDAHYHRIEDDPDCTDGSRKIRNPSIRRRTMIAPTSFGRASRLASDP